MENVNIKTGVILNFKHTGFTSIQHNALSAQELLSNEDCMLYVAETGMLKI